MKFREIAERQKQLSKLGDLKLPRKISVAIARNLATFGKEMESFTSQQQDIAKRFAIRDDNGEFVFVEDDGKQAYTFAPENMPLVNAEMLELNEVDIKIDIMEFNGAELDKCYEKDFYDILTPAQEASIGWMINYEDMEE